MCKSRLTILVLAVFACLFAVMSAQAAMQDPTRPPTAQAIVYSAPQKAKQPRWILSSTLVSAGRRTAVINNKVVARGERINGARVVSIEPSTVRLKINGRDITLTMLKKKIKSLSKAAAPGNGKK